MSEPIDLILTALALAGVFVALSGVSHRILERPRAICADDLPDADFVIATWWETAVWAHQLPPAKGRPVHLIQGYEVWTGGQVRERVHAALRLPGRKIAISQALARDVHCTSRRSTTPRRLLPAHGC